MDRAVFKNRLAVFCHRINNRSMDALSEFIEYYTKGLHAEAEDFLYQALRDKYYCSVVVQGLGELIGYQMDASKGRPSFFREYDSEYEELYACISDYTYFEEGWKAHEKELAKQRAERVIHEINTVHRTISPGLDALRGGLHLLFEMPPNDRETVIQKFSIKVDSAQEGPPCNCIGEQYVGVDDFGRIVVCTGCHTKFSSRGSVDNSLTRIKR